MTYVRPTVTVGTRGVMDISSGLCVLLVTAVLTVVYGKDVSYSNANQGRYLTLLAWQYFLSSFSLLSTVKLV